MALHGVPPGDRQDCPGGGMARDRIASTLVRHEKPSTPGAHRGASRPPCFALQSPTSGPESSFPLEVRPNPHPRTGSPPTCEEEARSSLLFSPTPCRGGSESPRPPARSKPLTGYRSRESCNDAATTRRSSYRAYPTPTRRISPSRRMLPEAPGQRIAAIRQASLRIHAHRSMVFRKGISVGKLEPQCP